MVLHPAQLVTASKTSSFARCAQHVEAECLVGSVHQCIIVDGAKPNVTPES